MKARSRLERSSFQMQTRTSVASPSSFGIFPLILNPKKEKETMHSKRLGFLVLLIISICTPRALGQVDVSTATLKGAISDSSGALISGAIVTATSLDKGIVKS